MKNRVHLDVYVRGVEPLLDLGARVLAEYRPQRVTLADVEGNEFCAFLDPALDEGPPARAFAVCTDSDRPEELAAWWAAQVGADVRNGPDGTPRWLYGSAGWEGLIWKFVRVDDERVVPNRWQWTVYADPADDGVRVDPQGNEFSVSAPKAPSGLSRAVHIWRGLMKPSKPLEGIAAQPVVTVGAVGMVGVVHTAGLPAWAPHFGHALIPWVRRTFSATRICSDARRGRRIAHTAVGGPGGLLELQAAVVAVAGVGGPVAAGLALGDRVPVHGVGVGGARREGHRHDGERPGDGGGQQALGDCLTNVHHCGPSPTV